MEEPRPEKIAVIDEVRERLEGSSASVVTEYRGLTVAEMADLRKNLRAVGGDYKVFKNTLVRRALQGTANESLAEFLVGPTAIAFIADLPSREVLLSQLAGLFASPMQQLAGLMKAVPQSFAYGVKALIETKPAPAPAASPEPEAPVASDEPAPRAHEEAPATVPDESEVVDQAAAPEAVSEAPEEAEAQAVVEEEVAAEVADAPDQAPADEA